MLKIKTKIEKFHICNGKILLFFLLTGVFLFPQIAYQAEITDKNIIKLTNQERKHKNLNSLTANQYLAKTAHQKAQDIIKTQTFAHHIKGKKFSSWAQESNYDYAYLGENLAIDFSNCESVIKAWLESPSHRENLLNPNYEEIGVAVIHDNFKGQETTLVVQVLGASASSSPILKQNKVATSSVQNNTANNEQLIVKNIDSLFLKNIINHLEIKNILLLMVSTAVPLLMTYLYFLTFIKIFNFLSHHEEN